MTSAIDSGGFHSGSIDISQLPSLTPLRGIAALVVMLFHFAPLAFGPRSALPEIANRGYLAVDLFFMLSGFVLAHVYGDRFAAGIEARSVLAFLRARLARIYPLHVVTLAFLALVGVASHWPLASLAHNLLLTHGPWLPGAQHIWNPPSWSISGEWHAYLLFPVLALALGRMPTSARWAMVAACVSVLTLIASAGNISVVNGPAMLGRVLPEFTIGMLLHRLFRSLALPRFFAADSTALIALGAVIAAASWPNADLWAVTALATLLVATASNDRLWKAALETPACRFLGEISYSLYMVHVLVALVALRPLEWLGLTRWSFLAALAGLSLICASALSRWVEYPARDWLRGRGPKRLARKWPIRKSDGSGRVTSHP
jgi:peptidoglycan/LPS O-acetylase OafA/YrhL